MINYNFSYITAITFLLLSGYLCEDVFIRAALKSQQGDQNVGRPQWKLNNTENWPSLKQSSIAPPLNSESSRINVQEWPTINERRQPTHQTVFNRQPFNNNSFVQSQIQRWNSQNTPHNNLYNQAVKKNSTNFTGIRFDDQNNNGQTVSTQRDTNIQVTDNELREFSEELLLKDDNNAAKYVRINFQGRTTSRSKNDEAPLPLLSINEDAYKVATIAKLLPLYDNYIVKSNVNEEYTNEEKQEENTLLKAILNTNIMKTARNFLIEKGAISGNERDFENLIHDMWFHLYSRGKGKIGSSGFEHVFLAEIKNGDVSGLHNWIYFEKEEANNMANYLGYLKKISLGDKGAILKFNFNFHGINKPVGSMFIGTSPEFEMALYSVCFILRANRVCPLKLNGSRFVIRTYTYKYDGKDLIGSAFPEI